MMTLLLSQQPYSFDNQTVQVPTEPGVYIIHNKTLNNVIYVGRTKNLRMRLMSQHRRGNVRGSQFRKALQSYALLESEQEISSYIKDKCGFRFTLEPNFEKRVRLEHFTTAILGPILNTKLKQ
jgi:hypothetical protein